MLRDKRQEHLFYAFFIHNRFIHCHIESRPEVVARDILQIGRNYQIILP